MKEQFIYMTELRNKHTNEMYVKVGYSADVVQRLTQLESANKHFEITEIHLFKHVNKDKGYWYDEQTIHHTHTKVRVKFDKETMPQGRTECYDIYNKAILTENLTELGYKCTFSTKK